MFPSGAQITNTPIKFVIAYLLHRIYTISSFVSFQNQRVDYHFVKHGGYCGALGAFVQGTYIGLDQYLVQLLYDRIEGALQDLWAV